jgi:AAA+ superfamily predicted ATPase
MSNAEAIAWLETNQRCLTAEMSRLRSLLEWHAARLQNGSSSISSPVPPATGPIDMPGPSTLETICEQFGLSAFERSVLLLCAAIELDSSFPALCAAIQKDHRKAHPTFSLALAVLPDAHWSALSPAGPLRYWRMIELSSSESLTTSPLRIDERILHYLTGVQYTDERLAGFVKPLPPPEEVVPSHQELTQRAIAVWNHSLNEIRVPVLQFYGPDSTSQRTVAAALCANAGLSLQAMSATVVPLDPRETEAVMRLWEREAALTHSALLLDCTGLDGSDHARMAALDRFVDGIRSAIILTGRERRAMTDRPSASWEVHKPTPQEQRALWQQGLGPRQLNGQLEQLVAHFGLNASALHSVCNEALRRTASGSSGDDLGTVLWDACRTEARPRLDELAQHISSASVWDDLVLPETQKRLLSEIAAHVKQRLKVYEAWGFGHRSSRGLGISALFVGPSGTGKTMAAEVLANALSLDLYRIDLSQVVSKYIGETEKNLRRVFDAAEDSGAILLFDEADALFGKRSEVKDSHDRYANIEISYLLQRMEAYRGLAILTTNMKDAIDTAFLRRIRFVVQFPFPNVEQRLEIWRHIFPADAPTEGLDMEKLSRLNVAGGSIRNIALHAAFLAADADEPVRMKHLLRAARVEYSKLEKSLTDTEIRGWS